MAAPNSRFYKSLAGHCNFSCSSPSAWVWGWTLSKKLFDKFNNQVSNDHCRWSDEFQIPNLRKAVTLAAILWTPPKTMILNIMKNELKNSTNYF